MVQGAQAATLTQAARAAFQGLADRPFLLGPHSRLGAVLPLIAL